MRLSKTRSMNPLLRIACLAPARVLAHLLMRIGRGSALPGLLYERLDRSFLRETLLQLPQGVIVVSGTNGKTTTTKLVTAMLRGQGLTVVTNSSGSNYSRGVVSMLLGAVDWRGRVRADIAVLELDEAHAVPFVAAVPPRFSLLLNAMRDQLDRYGEIDTAAGFLGAIADATTEGVVVNGDDRRLGHAGFAASSTARVTGFRVDPSLLSRLPREYRPFTPVDTAAGVRDETRLLEVSAGSLIVEFGGRVHQFTMALDGFYNALNAIAAIALCRTVLGEELHTAAMLHTAGEVGPAFGRGERILVGDSPIELVLVKNPGSFEMALEAGRQLDSAVMIAVNDNLADGRDVSWLWDVDFTALSVRGAHILTGRRAADVALRLKYDLVEFGSVLPSIPDALRAFIDGNPDRPKRVYCTYTAMLALRRELTTAAAFEGVR